jgi:hypothetical protein
LEKRSVRVRNCEKETSLTKWKAAISSLLILGSFLAEFPFATAIKNRLTREELVNHEGKLKCGGTLGEGEKAERRCA